jgi:hypothetical protein
MATLVLRVSSSDSEYNVYHLVIIVSYYEYPGMTQRHLTLTVMATESSVKWFLRRPFFRAGTSWGRALLTLVFEAEVSLDKKQLMFLSWNIDFLHNQPHFLCHDVVPAFRSYSNFVFFGSSHTFKSLPLVHVAFCQ